MAETSDHPVRRVWVTRAEPRASRTAERLQTLGFEPVVAPLLEIRFLTPVVDLADIAALAFTSINGVAAFSRLSGERAFPVFTVGDATARAARDAGFSQVQSASGDLCALSALIRDAGPSGPVLHPVAREPAGDLSTLVGRSITIRPFVVYETIETARATPQAFDDVLVHSPRGAKALAKRLSGTAMNDARIIAISPAAAEPLASLNLTQIRIADVPNETAMIAALGKPGVSL